MYDPRASWSYLLKEQVYQKQIVKASNYVLYSAKSSARVNHVIMQIDEGPTPSSRGQQKGCKPCPDFMSRYPDQISRLSLRLRKIFSKQLKISRSRKFSPEKFKRYTVSSSGLCGCLYDTSVLY